MWKMNMPNVLSCSRIVLALLMLPLMNSSGIFITLYFLCGITDVADGYIARKYNQVTIIGARLDSMGDCTFYVVVLVVLFFKQRQLMEENFMFILIVLLVRSLSVIVSAIRFKRIVFIHTLANKITGLLIFFMIPFFFLIPLNRYWIIAMLFVSILSAMEEFIILIKSKTINLNQKSLWK